MQDMITAGNFEYLFCNFLWDLCKLKIRKKVCITQFFKCSYAEKVFWMSSNKKAGLRNLIVKRLGWSPI